MAEQRDIPCTECEERIREKEEDGMWEVLECKPIQEKPGWCRLKYQLKQ
jgi:ribosomal protein L37AE/L43A